MVAGVGTLVNEPSALVPRLPNTGSLRLFGSDDIAEWEVVSEYRENSVFTGLSKLGGFWTTTNAVFAFLFGCSLMWVITGAMLQPLGSVSIQHVFNCRDKTGLNFWANP